MHNLPIQIWIKYHLCSIRGLLHFSRSFATQTYYHYNLGSIWAVFIDGYWILEFSVLRSIFCMIRYFRSVVSVIIFDAMLGCGRVWIQKLYYGVLPSNLFLSLHSFLNVAFQSELESTESTSKDNIKLWYTNSFVVFISKIFDFIITCFIYLFPLFWILFHLYFTKLLIASWMWGDSWVRVVNEWGWQF